MKRKKRIYIKWTWRLTRTAALLWVIAGCMCFGWNGARAAAVSAGAEAPGGTDIQAGEEAGDPRDVLATIRIDGQFEQPDRQALIDRLNEIRREACEEGINNPVNGEPLTEADYVPAVWSEKLEQVAALRAVETSVLKDHTRPDGSECFTVLPDSDIFSMETLAWGYGSAAEALEGWYSEKEAYTKVTGEPAGHYIALITPDNQYVGIADLRTGGGRDACAGAFGITGSENGDSTETAEPPASSAVTPAVNDHWEIPLTETLWRALVRKETATTARRIANAVRKGLIRCMR